MLSNTADSAEGKKQMNNFSFRRAFIVRAAR